MKRYLIILILLTIVQWSYAQIVTDRPNQTESSVTVPEGALQIESGVSIGYTGDNLISVRQILLPSSLFRYGLTDRLELRLINQIEHIDVGDKSWQGISDLQLGAKLALWNRDSQDLAFIGHVTLPLGSTELSSDDFGVTGKLSYAHVLSEKNSMGYNVGVYVSPTDFAATYTICLTRVVNDKVSVYVEPYGGVYDSDGLVFNFDAGMTYLLKDHIQLDFSFGTGLSDKMNYTALGCSWLFN